MYEKGIVTGLATLGTTIGLLIYTLVNLESIHWLVSLLFAAMAFIQSGLLVYFLPICIDGNWQQLIDTSHFIMEKIEAPMADGWNMVALVARHKSLGPGKHPTIICHHGSGGTKESVFHFGLPFALAGYVVVLPDARGHGESAPNNKNKETNHADDWWITEETGIIPDVHRLIDRVAELPCVDPDRIGMAGHSMGALATYAGGLPDPRIKIAVAMSGIYSFKMLLNNELSDKPWTKPWFVKKIARFSFNFKKLLALEEHVSPKYYFDKMEKDDIIKRLRVVHAVDDELVLFDYSFAKMREHTGLPDENVLILQKGEHGLHAQETLVTAKVLTWFNEMLK